jgi:hypothetical protein
MVDCIEKSPMILKKFQGNICLSNPQYDLYVDYGQLAFDQFQSSDRRKLRGLMDLVPSLDRPISVKAVAEEVGLREEVALEYLEKWSEKGLIELF